LNQLSNITRSGTLTVSGALPAPPSGVTVNGNPAQTNGDFTFASAGNSISSGTNTFTIIAANVYGTNVTNTLTVNLPATVVLQYDANGNLTNDGTRSFYYDAENQLTNVLVTGQYQEVFVYDGMGRRRIKTNYTWQGAWMVTNVTRYIYDGNVVIQERDTNNNVLVTYTRGLDLGGSLQGAGGIGGLLARTDTNGTTYYHCDGNGNVTALIDGNQNIVARYEYDAYGRLIGMWGTNAASNVYLASSKEYDCVSKIYYYGHRYYDPNLQRWLNRDPIAEAGGINMYAYVANDPVDNSDPFGLDTCTCDRKIGGGPPKQRGWLWNTTPSYSHTFTFTTSQNGTLKHTYSWGNTNNTHGWNLDQPEDIAAANEALKNGHYWNEGGSQLDPFVDKAFHELDKKENEHVNLGVARNCKTEAKKLLDKAKDELGGSK
jgi:RHS repeat-associated protein